MTYATAYETTIFEDARKDYSTRVASKLPTHGSTIGSGSVPLSLIPISATPRTRPFQPFEDSLPTPPPDSARFATSQEESTRNAADAAYVARQRALYRIPGVGRITPAQRMWNGRVIEGARPGLVKRIIGVAAGAAWGALVTAAGVLKAELRRGRGRGTRGLLFYLDRCYYRLLRAWRGVAIQTREVIAYAKLFALIVCANWAIVFVLFKTAAMLDDDPPPGKLEYVFVKEARSWSVAAL